MADIRMLAPDEYPSLLKEIPDAPDTLYIRGNLPPPHFKYLAVVGSRNMSRYGKDACEALISGLSQYPVAIVSGLALGVDGVAHTAALSAGLPTIAVPGSGLDNSVLYPRAHMKLSEEILKNGGALLSEFEPHFKARPESFPQRNRIMAGMSHAVLVIEATERSGTLITARLASEYNRDLLVVPHSIFAEGGAGGHIFTKIGATPVRTAQDILEALTIEVTTGKATAALNNDEEAVVDLLSEPMSRDDLMRILGEEKNFDTGRANALLMSMEIRGLIGETMGEVRKLI
jgi:DNA processing protein